MIGHYQSYIHKDFTFLAKQLESVNTKPGCWNICRIGVFKVPIIRAENKDPAIDWDAAEQVGETYDYGYSNFRSDLFYAFRRKNRIFALYSIDYTATRVMEIYQDNNNWQWRDHCGEERDAYGFCPVHFYVPENTDLSYESEGDPLAEEILQGADFGCNDFTNHEGKTVSWIINRYACDTGFVAGCCFGDDSSWKLRVIDLSKIEEKELKITDKFGYLELANMPLQDAIKFYFEGPNVNGTGRRTLTIAAQVHFDFDTGEMLNEGDFEIVSNEQLDKEYLEMRKKWQETSK